MQCKCHLEEVTEGNKLISLLFSLQLSVEATSRDPDVRIRFSLSENPNFYVNEHTGEIFLISNDGLGSLPSHSNEFT